MFVPPASTEVTRSSGEVPDARTSVPWRAEPRQSYAGLLGVACTVNAPEKPPRETLQLTVVVAPLATSGAMPALQVPIDFPPESDRLKVTED